MLGWQKRVFTRPLRDKPETAVEEFCELFENAAFAVSVYKLLLYKREMHVRFTNREKYDNIASA